MENNISQMTTTDTSAGAFYSHEIFNHQFKNCLLYGRNWNKLMWTTFIFNKATLRATQVTNALLCEKFPDRAISPNGDQNCQPTSCVLTLL